MVVKIEKELSEHFSNISGEGLAGGILALTALDCLMVLPANDEVRAKLLRRMEETVDQIFSKIKFVDGDEAMNERKREVARARCDEALARLRKNHLAK